MLGLLLLVIALIVYGSLYPWQFHPFLHAHDSTTVWRLLLHNWPAVWNRDVLRDAVLNVLLYVPMGALAFLTMARRRPSRASLALAAAAMGMALSVTMEIAQAYDATRDTGPLDVLTNTTGAAAGALAALLFRPSLESLIHRGTRRTAAAATVLAVVWASFQLYPFIPLIGYYRLLAGLALLAASPGMAPLECWTAAAEWFAIWLLIDTLELPKRRLAMAAVLLALPLRLFIPGRAVHWSDVLGAALAVILWRLSPSRWRLRLGVWMVASAILLRELAPFHFAESAAPFMWMPFSQTVANHRDGLMVILLGKAFDYGAAVWAFHAAGWSYRRAGGLLAAVLLVLEQVQRYLPGRTPETTDPVLALVMALALWLASDFHPRRR